MHQREQHSEMNGSTIFPAAGPVSFDDERSIMRRGFFVFITTIGIAVLLVSVLKISAQPDSRSSDQRISRISLVESTQIPVSFAGSFSSGKMQ